MDLIFNNRVLFDPFVFYDDERQLREAFTTHRLAVTHRRYDKLQQQPRNGPIRMAPSEGSNIIPGPPYAGPSVKPILDSIKTPADMKGLDLRSLKQVRYAVSWFCDSWES